MGDTAAAALDEWVAYVDEHLTPSADTIGDHFPNLAELREAKKWIQESVPEGVLKVVVEKPAAIERKTVPIMGLGESFRSKRQKVDEFFQKVNRREEAETAETSAFFAKQMDEWYTKFDGDHGSLGGSAGSRSASAQSGRSARSASANTGTGGLGSRQSGYKRPRVEPSPAIYRGASMQSNASARIAEPGGAATGPSLVGDSDTRYEERFCELTRISEISGDLEQKKRDLGPIVKELRKEKRGFVTDPGKYGIDSVRWKFKEDAGEKEVELALQRAIHICRKLRPHTHLSVDFRPIIIVPNIVNSVITLHNAKSFLQEGRWVDPMEARAKRDIPEGGDIIRIDKPNCPFKEFVVRNNPASIADREWDSVCCVFVAGVTWQFDGFYGKSGDSAMEPRDVLSKIPGYNIQYEDEALHANVEKWNLTSLRVSKTANRRHKDIKTAEDFWRAQMKRMPFLKKFRAYFKQN